MESQEVSPYKALTQTEVRGISRKIATAIEEAQKKGRHREVEFTKVMRDAFEDAEVQDLLQKKFCCAFNVFEKVRCV